jgi:glycosyltransferase involved in cell wall biosynthesis
MKTKKNALLIYTTMPSNGWGGSEELWRELAIYCKAQNQDIKIIVKYTSEVNPKFENLKNLGFDIYFIKSKENRSILKKLIDKFVRWRNDFGNIPQEYYEFLVYVNKFNPTHFLINQGGTFSFIEDELLLFTIKEVKSKYILISHHNFEYFTYPHNYITKIKNHLSYISKFFFVSKRNYEVAVRQLASPINSEVYFVQNPCKVKLDFHVDYPNSDIIKVAFLGRLENRNKGLDLLIDALSHDCFKAFSWNLEIWGEGPDKEYLVELVDFYNLSDNINFKGYTNNVVDVWKENQMLLLPSHNEGSPLVILEAMMCSRACFVTDVGDNSEYVKHNINGFLIPSSTKKLIIENLMMAFLKHKEWENFGKRAFEDVNRKISSKPEEELFNIIFKDKIQLS